MINLTSQSGGGGGSAVLQSVGERRFVPNLLSPYGAAGAYYWNSNSASVTMNTNGDEEYILFKVPAAFAGKTISEAIIFLRSVDNAGTASTGRLRVAIGRTLDAAGHADQSTNAVDYVDLINPTVNAFRHTLGVDWVTDGNAGTGLTALVANEVIWVALEVNNGCQVKASTANSRSSDGLAYTRSHNELNTDGANPICIVLKTSDGLYFYPEGCAPTLTGFTTWTANSSGQGFGIKLTAPYDCRICGIFAHVYHVATGTLGDAYWRLAVDGTVGNDLANVLQTAESKLHDYPDSKYLVGYQNFSAPVEVAKDDVIYAILQHQDSVGDLRIMSNKLSDNDSHAAEIVQAMADIQKWSAIPVTIAGGSIIEWGYADIWGVGIIVDQIKAE